jgi:hypothetical protein
MRQIQCVSSMRQRIFDGFLLFLSLITFVIIISIRNNGVIKSKFYFKYFLNLIFITAIKQDKVF